MTNQPGATGATAAAEKSKSPPIKTRTERQETLVRMLRESLSRKISEKLMAAREREKGKEEGKEEGGQGICGSDSPPSTVSSSGEIEGGYTLHVDSLDSGDESGEHHMTVT